MLVKLPGIAVLLLAGCTGMQSAPPATDSSAGPVVFMVGTYPQGGAPVYSPAAAWHGAEHAPIVFFRVSDGRRAAEPDSVRLFARSGPVQDLPGFDIANVGAADSLGAWTRVDPRLLRRTPPRVPAPEGAIGGFDPEELDRWVDGAVPANPILTRVAAEVWINGRMHRGEVRIYMPA